MIIDFTKVQKNNPDGKVVLLNGRQYVYVHNIANVTLPNLTYLDFMLSRRIL